MTGTARGGRCEEGFEENVMRLENRERGMETVGR